MSQLADQLIVDHLAWTRAVAFNIARRLGGDHELEDVIQDGVLGLVKAAHSFDPERGVPFRCHALTRIRGEIVDALRRTDPASRSDRRLFTLTEQAERKFMALEQRVPSSAELAAELEISAAKLATLQSRGYRIASISLEDEVPGTYSKMVELLVDERVDREHSRVLVDDLTARLRARERLVLDRIDDGYTLREIGLELGVSESRVCQISGVARRRLGQMMAA